MCHNGDIIGCPKVLEDCNFTSEKIANPEIRSLPAIYGAPKNYEVE